MPLRRISVKDQVDLGSVKCDDERQVIQEMEGSTPGFAYIQIRHNYRCKFKRYDEKTGREGVEKEAKLT